MADAIEATGAHVDRDARPSFSLLDAERLEFDLWVAAASASMSDDELARQRSITACVGPNDDSRRARRARAATMVHRDWLHLDGRRRDLQQRWEQLFADVHVIVCPVAPVVAYEVDPQPTQVDDLEHRLERTIAVDGRPRPYLDQLVWTTAVGLARLPVTTVPIGRTPEGLPVGAQVVGASFTDLTTLRVGGWLSDATGGFQPPVDLP